MTTELKSTGTIVADEPGPVAAALETVKEPEAKDTRPIPTEEEVKENGLYYYFLSERERALYKSARKTEGLRDEIAMLRVKIAHIHVNDPANVAIVLRAMSLLERLIKTHYRLFGTESERRAQMATNPMSQKPSPNLAERMPRAEWRRLAREQAKRHTS